MDHTAGVMGVRRADGAAPSVDTQTCRHRRWLAINKHVKMGVDVFDRPSAAQHPATPRRPLRRPRPLALPTAETSRRRPPQSPADSAGLPIQPTVRSPSGDLNTEITTITTIGAATTTLAATYSRAAASRGFSLRDGLACVTG